MAGLQGLAAKVTLVHVSAAKGAHGVVVLLVEDEFLIRWNIAECLREAGYTVVETASGEEAIAICRSGVLINIVFTDINLIGSASGWDVAEFFRADCPDVSVLYTSGNAIDNERCVPGSAFIAKPYQAEGVLSACQQLRR